MVLKGSEKDDENIEKSTEKIIESNSGINNIDRIDDTFSRDKALNFIRYGAKSLNDNFDQNGIIEEEEEEEEEEGGGGGGDGEGKEKENDEEKNEDIVDREFRSSSPPKQKHFLRNSKSYISLRENYTEIQDRVVEMARKEEERRKNRESFPPGEEEQEQEPQTEPIVNLENEKEELDNHKEMFEEEDKIPEEIPITGNMPISEYRKYQETISTPLEAINESNIKYRQLEKSINQAQDKLNQLIEAENNSLEEEKQHSIKEDSKNNSKTGSRKSFSSDFSNSRSNISFGHRSKYSSLSIQSKLKSLVIFFFFCFFC